MQAGVFCGVFCWWRQHFEFQPACMAVDGRTRSNVVQNTCARLQISLLAQFKTRPKSHESYVFLYPFSNMTISPPPPPKKKGKKKYFIPVSKQYGLSKYALKQKVWKCACVCIVGRRGGGCCSLDPQNVLCQAVSVYQCITQTAVLSVSVCYQYISV